MINIYTTPTSGTDFFAYNDIYFDASSDDANIVRMYFDLYINDTYQTTLQKSPNLGTTNIFTINTKGILQDFLEDELNTTYSGFAVSEASTSACHFKIRAFEVLDNGTTFDTSWAEDGAGTSYQESSNFDGINGGVERNVTKSDYDATSGSAKKFLTNRPDSSKILNDTDFQIGFYTDAAQAGAIITQQDSDQNTLSTHNVGAITPQYGKGWVHIDSSQFDPDLKFLLVVLNTAPLGIGQSMSETRTYEVVDECNDKTIRLYWQNPLGGWDYYYFAGNRQVSHRANSRTFDKKLPRGYDQLDTEETVLNVNSNKTYRGFTRSEDKELIQWLTEIGRSEQVYWLDGSTYKPVIVTGQTQNVVNDRDVIMQYAVTFRLSSQEINQRG